MQTASPILKVFGRKTLFALFAGYLSYDHIVHENRSLVRKRIFHHLKRGKSSNKRADSDTFVGRSDEIVKLSRWLCSPDPLPVVVVGPLGTGKTHLLQHIARESEPGSVYLPARGSGKAEAYLKNLVEAWEHAVGRPRHSILHQLYAALSVQIWNLAKIELQDPISLLRDLLDDIQAAAEHYHSQQLTKRKPPLTEAPEAPVVASLHSAERIVVIFDDVDDLINEDRLAHNGGRQAFQLIASFCNACGAERKLLSTVLSGSSVEILQALSSKTELVMSKCWLLELGDMNKHDTQLLMRAVFARSASLNQAPEPLVEFVYQTTGGRPRDVVRMSITSNVEETAKDMLASAVAETQLRLHRVHLAGAEFLQWLAKQKHPVEMHTAMSHLQSLAHKHRKLFVDAGMLHGTVQQGVDSANRRLFNTEDYEWNFWQDPLLPTYVL
eukprot:TRINITY_DN2562_c0_g1_i4.p1 TRINITY_DN2562_c0_g1~~TRINITY_DN2562_c0_g1_i4.p1  ORF type:complete len:440 (+),score=84.71 TRINITY_DN2562_c0_g1_i4:175-1494(+)